MILRGHVKSEVLGMDTGLTVVAPDAANGGPYKVAYLLHGLHGNSGTWADYTMLPAYAAEYQTVFVMPDAGRSFYADLEYGPRYETYITRELPKICQNLFRISACREDTAIIGGSMGGYGALKFALKHPWQYGMCCAFASACLFLREDMERQTQPREDAFREAWGELLLRDFQAILGKDLEMESGMDLPALAHEAAGLPQRPKFYLACGQSDRFLEYNIRFSELLKQHGFDVTYEEWQAGHDWAFMNKALRMSLRWCYRS